MLKKIVNDLSACALLLALLVAPCGCTSPDSVSPAATASATRYAIIITGDELLTGIYADGHTPFLTRTLRPLGLECVVVLCVGDTQEALRAALDFAVHKAPLVLVTGGLGPTDNDITRETISQFTGVTLEEDPDVLARMAARLNTPPEQLRANLRRQCRVPAAGRYLDNPHGTAVGLWCLNRPTPSLSPYRGRRTSCSRWSGTSWCRICRGDLASGRQAARSGFALSGSANPGSPRC